MDRFCTHLPQFAEARRLIPGTEKCELGKNHANGVAISTGEC
jgi:hypothetical protein